MSTSNGDDSGKKRDLDHELERLWKESLRERLNKIEEENDLHDQRIKKLEKILEELRKSVEGLTDP